MIGSGFQQEKAESAENQTLILGDLKLSPISACSASSCSSQVIAHLSHVISKLTALLELALLKGHAELATKQDLHRLENIMAKTQAEVAQQLRDALAKLGKIETEQDNQALLIKALLEAAANQPNASDELTAAADALSAELEVSDAKVDDAAAPAPEA